MPDISVVTVVRGRLDHLSAQQSALLGQPTPYERVVVRMGGPDLRHVLGRDDVRLVEIGDDGGGLPLAAARNAGVEAASADVVVLLDVDCIPAPDLLNRYADALADVDGLVAGPVGYLPPAATAGGTDPARLARIAVPHPARPVPPDGVLRRENRYELFWSLSFAVRRHDFQRLGGFYEGYRGYGGEDTDFALSARRAGVPLHWVGGAWAWHQHHPVSDPPVEHLADIVTNSRLFYRRWGRWPMLGWLGAFRDEGLLDWEADGDRCRLTPAGATRTRSDTDSVSETGFSAALSVTGRLPST